MPCPRRLPLPWLLVCLVTLALLAAATPAPAAPAPSAAEPEIREHQGRQLAAFDRAYDNSIKGPQKVDRQNFRLRVRGLVERPLELTYEQVLALPSARRVVTMPCVEGWSETLLYDGARVADILAQAGLKPGAKFVVFRAADGYDSALSLVYIAKADALLGHRINGRTLDANRGFPFQVVAEHMLGYKWVKWVVELEVTDKPHQGYWEKRGYPDDARTDR